ncbi:hypothetical protein AVEN_20368-1 [Araneus ventricosus]|uniref:Uncharacterized protein n=1 Tax=Araneus ventricosus TaxID=182803 RepID=A0A4Y2FVD4_ARAVE|nr:hypothetical protein AVEN_20368-1 [Araneus ventricosus]
MKENGTSMDPRLGNIKYWHDLKRDRSYFIEQNGGGLCDGGSEAFRFQWSTVSFTTSARQICRDKDNVVQLWKVASPQQYQSLMVWEEGLQGGIVE